MLISRCKWFGLFLLFFPWHAWAYPEFISHGYASCLTCHYNGAGSGPLTDYGRALWSAEIASRALYPKSITDEDIGGQSGFLGSVPMPFWLRPDIKYRGLYLVTDPGSAANEKSRYLQMESDIGIVLQSKSNKYVGVLNIGRLVPTASYGLGKQGLDHMFAREYYLRVEAAKTWWVYAGLMEKVFGIRNIDHTSFQRMYAGFAPYNNTVNGIADSTGVMVQKIDENRELTVNVFTGNPYDKADYKQSGASFMGEWGVGENKRLGGSLLTEKNNLLKKNMAAVHYRQAVGKGSALLTEYGLIQDSPTGGNKAVGSYNLVQALTSITRGYFIKTTVERYNKEFKSSSPDQWKWSFGLLMFPLPRVEWRLEAVNQRSITPNTAGEDSWAVQGQMHVSL